MERGSSNADAFKLFVERFFENYEEFEAVRTFFGRRSKFFQTSFIDSEIIFGNPIPLTSTVL